MLARCAFGLFFFYIKNCLASGDHNSGAPKKNVTTCKGVFGMPKIDIGKCEELTDVRYPFVGMIYDDDLSLEARIVAFAIQRLVDMDLPLTISTISDATDLDHWVIKQKIDEIERTHWKLREFDEETGKYYLIRQ